MLSWSDVSQWSPGALETSTYDVRTQRETLTESATTLASALRMFQSQGNTATTIRISVRKSLDELDEHVGDVSELMMATADATDGVAEVRSLVQDCLDYAAVYGFVIETDGTVAWPSYLDERYGSNAEALTVKSLVEKLSEMIAHALSVAEQVDDDYVRRLCAVGDGTYSSPASRETPDAASQGLVDLPQPGWSPTEVSVWWSALSVDERNDLIAQHPDLIGNLDGIDAVSRDQANRIRLERMVGPAEEEFEKAKKALEETSIYDQQALTSRSETLRDARERLDDLLAVKDTLRNGDRQLLVLDSSGERLKAAVAVGNVDTAAHVSVFVPGNGTTVAGSLEGHDREMSDLRREAADRAKAPREEVATIAWLGYDTPQSDLSLLSTERAQAGADRLTPFLEGIQSSHMALGAGDPHMSALGHSYGSTTVGIAMTQVHEGVVDDAVLFGSPGSGVSDVSEYRLGPEGAYVSGVPSGDWIQGIGGIAGYGRNPMDMNGFTHLSGDAEGAEGGYDPSVSWWQFWDGAKNHSVYLKSGSEAFRDIARVVGGAK